MQFPATWQFFFFDLFTLIKKKNNVIGQLMQVDATNEQF